MLYFLKKLFAPAVLSQLSQPSSQTNTDKPFNPSTRLSLEGKWITGGFGLVLVLIGAVSFTSYQNAIQLAESAKRVRETNSVLKTLTNISATLLDAESGRRGYILFDDPEELARYDTAVSNLQRQINRLRETLTNTPSQQQRLDKIERLILRRLNLFQQSIDHYSGRQRILPSQDPLITQIKQNRDEIRQLIAELVEEEETLLEEQVEQSHASLRVRMLLELLGTVLTFFILFGVYALLYRQLTKRQQAEALQRALAQEKELSELKLQFFSMISHEFRTPLSLIVGSAQLLEGNLKPSIDPAKLKNLYRIQSAAKTMTQMLSDVLTLARVEAGRLEFNPSLVEIQTFCLNLLEDFQVHSESKQPIKFIREGNCTHAWVDEKLLYSILSNLLANAIKYSPSEKPVYFTMVSEPDELTFRVKDEGIGISPQDQFRLYEPFNRGENAKAFTGTGLGLSIVKKCVDLHQGEIFLDSNVDVGTTFTVKIPQRAEKTVI